MEKMMQHLQDLIHKKKGLDLKWEQEHLKMVDILLIWLRLTDKVREVITISNLQKLKKLSILQNKIEEPAPQVSVAT